MEKVPMTIVGYEMIEVEMKQLKTIERPNTVKAIAEARAHGDLSENAEYHAAKERQSFIEGRLMELESIIGRAEVIDPASLSGAKVMFGATVHLVDEETDEEVNYQIVGEIEADVKQGRVSIGSPIARALITKEIGETIEVKTPRGGRFYEILKIEFK